MSAVSAAASNKMLANLIKLGRGYAAIAAAAAGNYRPFKFMKPIPSNVSPFAAFVSTERRFLSPREIQSKAIAVGRN